MIDAILHPIRHARIAKCYREMRAMLEQMDVPDEAHPLLDGNPRKDANDRWREGIKRILFVC